MLSGIQHLEEEKSAAVNALSKASQTLLKAYFCTILFVLLPVIIKFPYHAHLLMKSGRGDDRDVLEKPND